METEFLIEKRLRELNPGLHARLRNSVVLANSTLTYCCAVVRNRSDFIIRQEKVRLELEIIPG